MAKANKPKSKYTLEIRKDSSDLTYGFYIYERTKKQRGLIYSGDGFSTPEDVRLELEAMRDLLNEVLNLK